MPIYSTCVRAPRLLNRTIPYGTTNTRPSRREFRDRAGMRVLFLAPKECWPPTTGAMLRNYHLAREVARAARVTYLSFSDTQAGAATPDKSHASANDPLEAEEADASPARWCEQVVAVPRGRGYTLTNLARGALGQTPVTVLNYTTREMARELG